MILKNQNIPDLHKNLTLYKLELLKFSLFWENCKKILTLSYNYNIINTIFKSFDGEKNIHEISESLCLVRTDM
jgi:hypothetical protein